MFTRSRKRIKREDVPGAKPQSTYEFLVPRQFIVGVDFGTTSATVAYHCHDGASDQSRLTKDVIRCIMKWPDRPAGVFDERTDTPTDIVYGVLLDERDLHVTCGYGALYEGDGHVGEANANAIKLSKLFLEPNSILGEEVRRESNTKLQILKSLAVIKADVDVIGDVLHGLLSFTSKRLRETESLNDVDEVFFTFTIPPAFSMRSGWAFQDQARNAIERAGFAVNAPNIGQTQFNMLSEAEAVARCLLEAKEGPGLQAGDNFAVVDAGGGTVDFSVYRIGKTGGKSPLEIRLNRELVVPAGKIVGAMMLNVNLKNLLVRRLRGATLNRYQANGVETFESDESIMRAVAERMLVFEENYKRSIDIYDPNTKSKKYPIRGLVEDESKGFGIESVILRLEDFKEIFVPVLTDVGDLIMDQLSQAHEKRVRVRALLAAGGFSANPSLQRYIEDLVKSNHIQQMHPDLQLCFSSNSYSSQQALVAKGAVLCTVDSLQGLAPSRLAMSSLGFLKTDFYRPQTCRPHRLAVDGHDSSPGRFGPERIEYIKTIAWFVKKGQEVPSPLTITRKLEHEFNDNEPTCICEEILYILDGAAQDHYQPEHPKNTGARVALMFEVDMTPYRESLEVEETDDGEKWRRIEWELQFSIDHGAVGFGAKFRGSEVEKKYMHIAPAFVSGTGI